MHGTEGEAVYDGTLTRGATGRLRLIRGTKVILDEPRSPTDEYVESFYLFERACTDAMLCGGSVDQTGEENLRTIEATFAAYAAAERGEVIRFAEWSQRGHDDPGESSHSTSPPHLQTRDLP